MDTALLLIRTPLQARIALEILSRGNIADYELLYFSQHGASADSVAFQSLAGSSRRAIFIRAPAKAGYVRRTASFARQSRRATRGRRYNLTIFASLDEFVFSSLAVRKKGRVITFDDGFANLNYSGSFYRESLSRRAETYRFLLGAPRLQELKRNIWVHYTIFPNCENVVERGRLREITIWQPPVSKVLTRRCKKYFVGQPFAKYLDRDEVDMVRTIAEGFFPDFYLTHPMEVEPLLPKVPLMETRGLLAEDAILREVSSSAVHVIGGVSTVLFNLAILGIRVTMISPKFLLRDETLRVAERLGVEVLLFDLVD